MDETSLISAKNRRTIGKNTFYDGILFFHDEIIIRKKIFRKKWNKTRKEVKSNKVINYGILCPCLSFFISSYQPFSLRDW